MEIRGEMILGQRCVSGQNGSTHAINPATGQPLEPAFGFASEAEVDQACALAEAAFDDYRHTSLEQRAAFLERIADNILALGNSLIERAQQETGLPQARLEGERGRTVNQLRLFAQVVRAGYWLAATLDSALPERTPARPDLRLQKIPLGPVAVFGASNFPLAFSVAGGDTAAALAAGCPAVVKAHNAHPGTSELVARAIQAAVKQASLPEGVFSMLFGAGAAIGQQLAAHPLIQAIGFTGSRSGGLALLKTAQQRAVPIPVYAEMSSINPVYLLPAALATNAANLAQQFVDSLTLGAGQFCTNPGLVLALRDQASQDFIRAASAALSQKAASTMLSPGIHQAYQHGTATLASQPNLNVLARGQEAVGTCAAQAMLSVVEAKHFMQQNALHQEVFGPSSLIILCDDVAQMLALSQQLEGQLTVTLHANAEDTELAGRLLRLLERKAGRILFNGFPTGVEVCHAMVHGGPYPATTDSRSTSVGASAIERFLRPVCYQAVPENLLPAALQTANPWQVPRSIDGQFKSE